MIMENWFLLLRSNMFIEIQFPEALNAPEEHYVVL
jgi:hypothetical protein